MTKRELRELIRSTIKEYTGTGSFRNPVKGGQNPRASQRSRFDTDEDELEFYNDQKRRRRRTRTPYKWNGTSTKIRKSKQNTPYKILI